MRCYTKYMQKLYCYVDETGQDARSNVFIVVAVVSEEAQSQLRQQLIDAEQDAGIGLRKWHDASHDRRINFLQTVLDQDIAKGDLFYSSYEKPIPYFFPLLNLVAKAIAAKATGQYKTKVYVDGIDRKKAKELTNALRIEGVSLGMVKMRRDESEPLIRLADRWAGCVRAAIEGNSEPKRVVKQAKQKEYLREITH